MKSLLRSLVRFTVSHDAAWSFLNGTLVRLAKSFENHRKDELVTRGLLPFLPKALHDIAPDGRVAHGPFQGMIYPKAESAGSSLLPKLLGTYETELHPLVRRLAAIPFRTVVDVGSAEGFYAVGMARLMPQARVLAYDVDDRANALCAEMARANGVADRVQIRSRCSPEELIALKLPAPSLIICDCEGFEAELFTPETVPHLAHQHLLIEVHDFIDIGISTQLRERFAATHDLEAISSIDDVQKPLRTEYQLPELSAYNLPSRKILLAEHRPAIMEWFFFRPKTAASAAQQPA